MKLFPLLPLLPLTLLITSCGENPYAVQELSEPPAQTTGQAPEPSPTPRVPDVPEQTSDNPPAPDPVMSEPQPPAEPAEPAADLEQSELPSENTEPEAPVDIPHVPTSTELTIEEPLIAPIVYATTTVYEEFRPEPVGLPQPWTVSELTLTWEPLPDYLYHLIYDEEQAPGTIDSPWRVTHEAPASLLSFDLSSLPTIHVLACYHGSCVFSEPVSWDLSAYPQVPR